MTIFELQLFWLTIAPSYYWLMYAIWFTIWYLFIKKTNVIPNNKLDDLLIFLVVWVILWWRLGYVLFYDLIYYIQNPIRILKVWEWWMSFHWWALWVIISTFIFSKINKINFLKIIDEIALIVTVWIWAWRIWNYLNKELLWFEYNWFLAVEKNWINYFPSPLLEAFLEWLVLFLILFFVNKYKKFNWLTWACFLIWYWFFRTIIEVFFRTPDIQIGYFFWFITMWMILSIPMIIIWIILIFIFKKWNWQ